MLAACLWCVCLALVSQTHGFVGLTSTVSSTRKSTGPLAAAIEENEVAYYDPRGDGKATGKTRKLPLFPLQQVTCPTGRCALHIFEMRYRQLMNDINSKDSKDNQFGIVLLDSNRQIGSIGTIVQVVERTLLPDGRQFNMNLGQERFKLLKIIQEQPYIIGLVGVDITDEEPEEGPGKQAIEAAERQVWETLQDVVRLSNKVHNKTKVTVSDQVSKYAPGSDQQGGSERLRRSNFSFAVTEMLDVPARNKQLMLQTTNISERLAYQFELLEKARNFLAAQASLKSALD